ncbi:putative cullin-like protein 4 [Brassica napus]|uniref:putative cullin-like protein 4 n=1 Tax=Brassica napus TaxID=3708 RepID=UPI0006AB6C39|nr:putative cullin-like protein 4 [Brassica napus]XP_048607970.1 putative cullin-like protein 4 [Brassica napus]
MWGIYISTTLESLAVHCNDDDDDDPSLLLLPLEKFCLEYGEKFKLICSIGGVQGRIKFLERKVWDLGFELLPTKLFLASQVRDKVRTSVLLLITDQRLGKSVNLSLLKNLMLMLNGSVSRELRFLEKPFLDSTAEFYAAEAKQVLEQSSDLPHYLKHIDQRVGEEKKKCKSLLPLFSRLQDELLQVLSTGNSWGFMLVPFLKRVLRS